MLVEKTGFEPAVPSLTHRHPHAVEIGRVELPEPRLFLIAFTI